jgi:hypothetical protein
LSIKRPVLLISAPHPTYATGAVTAADVRDPHTLIDRFLFTTEAATQRKPRLY